jgi:hypothetical protein
MDADHFDALLRSLTTTPSRRGVTRTLNGQTLIVPKSAVLALVVQGATYGACPAASAPPPPPTCTDGVKNGSEKGIDCGGPTCPRCSSGQTCSAGSDCTTLFCQSGVCHVCDVATCGSDAFGNCFCVNGVCRSGSAFTAGSCDECGPEDDCLGNPGDVTCYPPCGSS